LAQSDLLQWFCRIDRVDVVRVPSKSTLDRYEKLVPETVVRRIIDQLNGVAASTGKNWQAELGLEKPLDIESLFLGYELRRGEHPLPGRLGFVAGCDAHVNQGGGADPQAWAQEPDGRAPCVDPRDQSTEHPDDPYSAAAGQQEGAQAGVAADEEAAEEDLPLGDRQAATG
jgi:hypothetical protein